MSMPLSNLESHNVQTIVPASVHKALRDEAYERKIPLKDLIREVLTQYTAEK